MEITYLNTDGERISKTCDLEFGKELQLPSDKSNLLLANKELDERGFLIFRLQEMDTFLQLQKTITAQIIKWLSLYQSVPDSFELNRYHTYLTRPDIHFRISTWALDYEILGDTFYEIKKQAEELLNTKLKTKRINHLGIEVDYVGFRILRPMKNDHNPFHRDAWIPYWRDTVNIWLPICGFEDANSLQLIPKSHLWPYDEILKTKAGVEIEGKKYHVPAAIGTVNDFTIETPILEKGEAIIFSPYLIHGNGVNKQKDTTRVSLEFRFCKA